MTHATLATKMRLCKMVFARLRSCLLHPTMWQSYNTCRGNSTATVHITHCAQEWWWERHMKLSACQKVSLLLPLYYHSTTTTTIYYCHSTATIMQKMFVVQRKRFWKWQQSCGSLKKCLSSIFAHAPENDYSKEKQQRTSLVAKQNSN